MKQDLSRSNKNGKCTRKCDPVTTYLYIGFKDDQSISTESSDRLVFQRRKPLQTLGGFGVVGLAGCSGDTESDPSENDEDTDSNTTPEETTDSEPDYSLSESEHSNPVDMATE